MNFVTTTSTSGTKSIVLFNIASNKVYYGRVMYTDEKSLTKGIEWATKMSKTIQHTDPELLAKYLSRIGMGAQILAVALVIGGAIIAADGMYPLLAANYTMILASGALIFAASLYFKMKALEARLDARET